jgi:hypothetical protein
MKHGDIMKVAWILIFIIFIFLTLPIADLVANDLPARCGLPQNNWKNLYSNNGITLYSQKTPGSDVLALKATSILKAPLDQILEVLRKVEISKEWIPHFDKKIVVKEISDIETITYSVNAVPWPFANRSLLLHSKMRLDRGKKYLVVETHSVNLNTNPIKENHVRANLYCGQMIMRPKDTGQTEIEFIIFVDPRGQIPIWLINIVQKSLPYDFLKALEKKASRTN